ncbi:MAG: FAD-dependent oxidoreductase, partial [Bacteroidetes bacterium]|nr:FAD-dependent oxidoreductase [Bacteroidota bacterium]
GAGAAGLYAGYLLQAKGIDFTILEASNTHGGRLGKLSGFADYDLDTGAQWLHGRNSILGDLAQQTNTEISIDNSELKYWFKGEIKSSLPKDPFIFENDNLSDISFLAYAEQQGFDNDYANIIEALAGDQGADASLLSAYWNYKDEENWISGDEDYKFAKSFYDLIHENIAKSIIGNIQYNSPVSHIDYTQEQIQVRDSVGNFYLADKLIITVPISILKLEEITFNPALPNEKTAAFSKIGMGPGMKVFLKFSAKFYEENLYGGDICAAYVDESEGKPGNDHVLLAFVMGHQAAYLSSLGSDSAITNALLNELDAIYGGQASSLFIASSVHDYTNKDFIKGAYSYSSIGMGNAREIAAQPINNSLFFAGEAMNTNGHHQTVHGAVESGYKAVMDLFKGIEK